MYMSMPSPPRFSLGSSKSASTDVAGNGDADAPETRASSDAETRAETRASITPSAGASLPSHHSRHPSGVSDITVDSDEGSEGGNETDVSEATAALEAERDREMYRTMSPSGRKPRRTRASGEEAASTPMGAIDDELRRLEDVPMISLENFMRFRGGDDAETGSGYESESSLAESLAESSFANDASAYASRPLASDAAHYDANTDLDVEEEVDPRVGAALDEMNDAASGVNDLEKALTRARRRRRAARNESEKKLEAIRLRVAKSVRNAVPYFHQQALASTHERNAQDALAQYERAHDAYALARDDVESKMKVWRDGRERSRENGFEAHERLTPSKRADLAAANEAAELTAYVEISESCDLNVLEAMRTRAENAYGTHIKNATASIDAALRLKRKLTRTIGKARPYFEAKAMAEGAWDALDEKVRDAQEDVREGKRRYQCAMAELARISEEVHERREREKAEREAERARAEAEAKREAEAVVSALVAFALETVIARAEAEAQAAREAAEAAAREAAAREAAEAAAREEAAREAAEAAAREEAAREAAEAAAREEAAREAAEAAAREEAAREAAEAAAREKAAREAAEAAAREEAAREAAEAAAREKAAREAAEVAAREAAAREAAEAAAREAAAKEAADAAAKERVETEAREAAERQVAAREASEREAEEAAARDAAEKEAAAKEAEDAADLEAARRGEAAVADVSSEETATDESNEALVRSVVADAVASVADAATAKANAEANAAALDFFGLDDAAAPAPAPADDPFESLASLEPAAAATAVRENGSGVANAPAPATGSLMDF